MTRSTIDFGIDLGTTNSSIAVAAGDKVQVIRNNDNDQITPSAVRFLPNGAVQVGRKPYEHFRLNSDGSSFQGFKRQMGMQQPHGALSASGATPEQLAVEVLKSLRADAEMWAGEPIDAAVITVPAMFELAQCEATQRAAAQAGIVHAPLLQEPIAAGLAYGAEREVGESLFLVYDLGGGTFDATLLRVDHGRLIVVDLDGDNFLGGRDWDRKLSGLLKERLAEAGYQFRFHDLLAEAGFNARLDWIAEQEKIQLSRRDQVDVIFDGQVHDAAGRAITTPVLVSRVEYEDLIVADIRRSIEIIRRLLEKNRILPSALQCVVMVGGPTNTPLLRRMVASECDVTVETRVDPMTVVAEGAARFAAATPRPAGRAHVAVPIGAVKLQLQHPAVTDDVVAPVGGKAESDGSVDTVELVRDDGGWSSGRLPMTNGIFMTSVALVERRLNTFVVTCFDGMGRKLATHPEHFSITHGLAASSPPLARSLAVVYSEQDGTERRHVMIPKGAPLPAVARHTFSSARQISPGRVDEGDALDVHVIEGEFDNPELNRHVGFVRLTPGEVRGFLPANTPLEVTIRVTISREVLVSIYIPLLDRTIEGAIKDKVLLPTNVDAVRADLAVDARRLDEIRDVIDVDPARRDRINTLIHEVTDDLEAARAGERERGDRALRLRNELANEIDELEREAELPKLIGSAGEELQDAEGLVAEYGDHSQKQRLRLLQEEFQAAQRHPQPRELQRIQDEASRLYFEIATSHPEFWIQMFRELANQVGQSADVPAARHLFERGRVAAERRDIRQLREVCSGLWELLPSQERDQSRFHNIGLRL